MPLPLILIGIGAASSLYGGKKSVDAIKTTSEAKAVNKEAEEIYRQAESDLKYSRSRTSDTLENLGKLKLDVWSGQMGRFVQLFERLKNVEITGGAEVGELQRINEQLSEMKGISLKATEVLTGGIAAVGAGALAGVASYGGAVMFATASTGTAISSLAGAAATNATLAWFGGGALSAGGLGMAGGIYVLGGLVAGPVLAVGGAVFAAKAREKLALAKGNLAETRKAAEEMKNAAALVSVIHNVATDFKSVIDEMNVRMTIILDDFENMLNTVRGLTTEDGKINYLFLTTKEKQKVHLTVQTAQVMKLLLETPLLTKEGGLKDDCRKALQQSVEFIEAHK